MNVKRWLCVLATAPIGMFAYGCQGGCDEHPRSGQVENERVTEGDDAGRGSDEQAGAQGSELVAQTEEPMEQCIAVVERVMRCTANQPFNDQVTPQTNADQADADQAALTDEKLSRLAEYWREPGARRQSCEQILDQQTGNPFRDADSLNALVDATGQDCPDFADALEEADALPIIGNVDAQD